MLINTTVIIVLNCIVFLLHYNSPQDPIIRGSTAQRTGDRIVRALWPTSSDTALVASYLGAHFSSMCVRVLVWLGWSGIRVAGWSNMTNVVIQQNSRKLLMMDILMSETCWAHKKWNKIASDIKLVFYSSTINMMHGPINIRIWFISLLLNYSTISCRPLTMFCGTLEFCSHMVDNNGLV